MKGDRSVGEASSGGRREGKELKSATPAPGAPSDQQPSMAETASRNSRGRDERLEEILGECIDRTNLGETVDREKIAAEHPELAEDILRELETFEDLNLAARRPPALGTLGDYTLRRELGRGGMGVVYEAWQGSLERPVALKVLPGGIAADPKSTSRFLREAQIAGRLHHPQIVPVYGFGVEAGSPYYAMELVEGETLAHILERLRSAEGNGEGRESALRSVSRLLGWKSEAGAPGGKPGSKAAEAASPGEGAAGDETQVLTTAGAGVPGDEDADRAYCLSVAAAFAGVAEGLQHAHSRGVIHRDIKPSNLIVDEGAGEGGSFEGRVRILDFGLARLEGQESITGSGELLGTPVYMSPEQARARNVAIDHRTDVYSLGATLYEMLALRPPFKGNDHQDTVSQILTKEPRPPRQINARVPRDLDTIVLKCLRKEPGDRYGTAEALAQDLRRFARGDPIEARPQPFLEKVGRRLWRNRLRVAAACLAVLFLASAGVLVQRDLKEKQEAKLALYREKIFSAIGKMELGRPARYSKARTREVRPIAVTRLDGWSEGEDGLLSVAVAAADVEGAISDPVEEARDALRQAAELFPGRIEAHFYLARAERLLGREEEAEEALDRALGVDPGFFPALIARASASGKPEEEVAAGVEASLDGAVGRELVRDSLQAHRAKAKGEWKEAAEVLGRLLTPFCAGQVSSEPYLGFRMQTLLDRGRARLEMGDLDGALEDFATVRGLWPELIEPVLLLGKTYHRKGLPEQAEARFQEFFSATRRKDEFALGVAKVYNGLSEYDKGLTWAEKAGESAWREASKAFLLDGMGRTDELLQAAQRALELDPGLPRAHAALGFALYRRGELKDAMAEFRQAIQLDRTYAGPHALLGVVLCEQGELEAAIGEYREAIRLDPTNEEAHGNLGMVWVEQGKFDEAIAEFLQVLRLDPKSAQAHQGLGGAFHRQGKLEEAAAEYRTAIEIDPADARSHHSLGLVLRDQRRLEEAIAEYRKATEIDPESALFHKSLGSAFRRQGRFQEALEEYQKSIQLDPKYGAVHYSLGTLLEMQGKLDEAEREYREAIRLDPKSAEPHYHLGDFLRQRRGKLAEAEQELREAIRLDPKNAGGHNNLGIALSEQGKLDEAIAEYREAIRLDPKNAAAHSNMGILFREQGKIDEAIVEYRQAIRLDPKDAAAHLNLGIALGKKGEHEEAERESREAVRLDPESAAVHNALGNALSDYGKLDEAIAEYREAIRLAPKYAAAHASLGRALFVQKRLDDAIAELREAIRLDPQHVSAHGNLGKALKDQGKLDEAIEEYLEVLRLDPRNALNLRDLGTALLDQGKFAEAEKPLLEAVRLDPNCAEAHNNLGVALVRQGKLEEAIPHFQKAAEALVPGPSAQENLRRTRLYHAKKQLEIARPLLQEGKLGEAAAILQRTIELVPSDHTLRCELGRVLLKLGRVLLKLGRLAEAVEEYGKAGELRPSCGATHAGLASALLSLGKIEEAEAEYRKALDLNPEDPEARTGLADVLSRRGDLEGAENERRRAREHEPSTPEAHYARAAELQQAGMLDDAIVQLRLGIAVDPHNGNAYNDLGIALQLKGNYEEAAQAYREAIRIDPEGSFPYANLSAVLARLRRLQEALAAARQAVERGCDCQPAYDAIITVLRAGESLDLGAEIERLVPGLERIVEWQSQPRPGYVPALALALAHDSPARNPEKAAAVARRLAERSDPLGPDGLSFVAEIQSRCGNLPDAIETLEKLVSLPGATAGHRARLEEYRSAALPDLPTCGSIDAALERPEVAVLIAKGAEWRFFRGRTEPSEGLEWTHVDFDDSEWEMGNSGFGYGDDDHATDLDDMKDSYTTVYFRHPFEVDGPGALRSVTLRVLADDGCVAYLNGAEVRRVRAGEAGSRLAHDAVASEGAPEPAEWTELPLDLGLLRQGKNVLAIQALNITKESSDLTLIPEVRAELSPHHGTAYIRERLEATKAEGDAVRREILDFESKRFEPFRALAAEKGGDRAGLLAYLEGRLLQRRGEHREAAAKLEEAVAGGPANAEPYLRLVESLRALGRSGKAEQLLREALGGGAVDSREVWEAWWSLAAAELKRTEQKLPAKKLPAEKQRGEKLATEKVSSEKVRGEKLPGAKLSAKEICKLVKEAASARLESYAVDLLWALERLSRDRAIRINCGGEECLGSDGSFWGKDRFALGGRVFVAPSDRSVEGTMDGEIYRAARWFPRDDVAPRAYRIPLPPGRYRVTLGFAEVSLREPGKRSFDVLLEGKAVLEDCKPKVVDTAENFTFEQSVEDGHLDLEFVHKVDNPGIAAIAIERLP